MAAPRTRTSFSAMEAKRVSEQPAPRYCPPQEALDTPAVSKMLDTIDALISIEVGKRRTRCPVRIRALPDDDTKKQLRTVVNYYRYLGFAVRVHESCYVYPEDGCADFVIGLDWTQPLPLGQKRPCAT